MFNNDKIFGDKIKLFRSQRGWNQELLADKAGLSQSEISKIEGGKVKGERETIQKLANALEVQPFRNRFQRMRENRRRIWRIPSP